eukprot:4872598-Amphidinium_carterae.1
MHEAPFLIKAVSAGCSGMLLQVQDSWLSCTNVSMCVRTLCRPCSADHILELRAFDVAQPDKHVQVNCASPVIVLGLAEHALSLAVLGLEPCEVVQDVPLICAILASEQTLAPPAILSSALVARLHQSQKQMLTI